MKKKKMVKKMHRCEEVVALLINQKANLSEELNKTRVALEKEREEHNQLKFDYAQLEEEANCLTLMCDVQRTAMKSVKTLTPKQVIQSKENKSTIILWDDNSKTEIKCSEKDEFNPIAGLAVGFLKKILGRKNYHKIFVKGDVNVIDRDAIHNDRHKDDTEPAKKSRSSKKVQEKTDETAENAVKEEEHST